MALNKESFISEGDRFFDTFPNPSSFGIGPAWIGGVLYWSNGSYWRLSSSSGSFTSPVYNGDGTLASAVIDGISYVFTYSAGLLSTVVGGGVTKTYTYTGSQLTSVVLT